MVRFPALPSTLLELCRPLSFTMTPLFIIFIVLLHFGIATGVQCSSFEDCAPGFFCADKPQWAPYGTYKKLEAGAGRCYSYDACGKDFRCHPYSFRCVALPDYSKSGVPEGFGACNKSWDCGTACVKSECRFDCARGRCHVPGVLNPCSRGCTGPDPPAWSRCVYGTEGIPCDPTASEPCLRGLRCEKTTGQSGGTCRKGRVGMSCTSSDRCGTGLLCGSSGKCASSADGEPCKSDFFCPPGFLCSRATKKCTSSSYCAARMSRFQFRLGRGRASGT